MYHIRQVEVATKFNSLKPLTQASWAKFENLINYSIYPNFLAVIGWCGVSGFYGKCVTSQGFLIAFTISD